MISKFYQCQSHRPYHLEHTASRPLSEVKQGRARLVLGWETAWENWVSMAFFDGLFVDGSFL